MHFPSTFDDFQAFCAPLPESCSSSEEPQKMRLTKSAKCSAPKLNSTRECSGTNICLVIFCEFIGFTICFSIWSGGVWSLKLRPSADRLGNRLEKDWQREQGNANDFAKATFLTLESLMRKVKFLFNPCHSSFAVFPAECLRPAHFTLCWCLSWKLSHVNFQESWP